MAEPTEEQNTESKAEEKEPLDKLALEFNKAYNKVIKASDKVEQAEAKLEESEQAKASKKQPKAAPKKPKAASKKADPLRERLFEANETLAKENNKLAPIREDLIKRVFDTNVDGERDEKTYQAIIDMADEDGNIAAGDFATALKKEFGSKVANAARDAIMGRKDSITTTDFINEMNDIGRTASKPQPLDKSVAVGSREKNIEKTMKARMEAAALRDRGALGDADFFKIRFESIKAILDVDGNGKISNEELGRLNPDGNGVITQAEYEAFHANTPDIKLGINGDKTAKQVFDDMTRLKPGANAQEVMGWITGNDKVPAAPINAFEFAPGNIPGKQEPQGNGNGKRK